MHPPSGGCQVAKWTRVRRVHDRPRNNPVTARDQVLDVHMPVRNAAAKPALRTMYVS